MIPNAKNSDRSYVLGLQPWFNFALIFVFLVTFPFQEEWESLPSEHLARGASQETWCERKSEMNTWHYPGHSGYLVSFGIFIQIFIFQVFHLTFLDKQKKGQGKDRDPRPASKSQQRKYKNKGNKSVRSPVKAWLFPRVDRGAKGWAPVGRELGILGMGGYWLTHTHLLLCFSLWLLFISLCSLSLFVIFLSSFLPHCQDKSALLETLH